MITLISTPEYIEQVLPEIICRWVATESPNNFRLLRHDFDIVSAANNGGFLRITVAAASYNGNAGNVITVYNKTLDAMFTGEVQAGSTTTIIDTDIVFQAGFDPTDEALDPERLITYLNDNTLHAGYYFEGRLTINGVPHSLTIIASPDSYGYADLDVSGILRIITTLGKVGDYSELIMAETNKSGNFTLEYRECWYGSDEGWTDECNIWYYAEAVRSEEQGSNLHEYEADDLNCAPFFNAFAEPVYFAGLPFDLTFIMPERSLLSPTGEITAIISKFSSQHVLLSEDTYIIEADDLEGHLCSLTIDPSGIEENASYFTAEITAP